jgi:hypothetical protein
MLDWDIFKDLDEVERAPRRKSYRPNVHKYDVLLLGMAVGDSFPVNVSRQAIYMQVRSAKNRGLIKNSAVFSCRPDPERSGCWRVWRLPNQNNNPIVDPNKKMSTPVKFSIDKGVPLPVRKGNPGKRGPRGSIYEEVFASMDPGDSFIPRTATRNGCAGIVAHMRKAYPEVVTSDMKFAYSEDAASTVDKPIWRIWRRA